MLLQSLFDVLPVLALVGLGMGGLEVSAAHTHPARAHHRHLAERNRLASNFGAKAKKRGQVSVVRRGADGRACRVRGQSSTAPALSSPTPSDVAVTSSIAPAASTTEAPASSTEASSAAWSDANNWAAPSSASASASPAPAPASSSAAPPAQDNTPYTPISNTGNGRKFGLAWPNGNWAQAGDPNYVDNYIGSKTGWYYTWSSWSVGSADTAGLEFVPMLWGPHQLGDWHANQASWPSSVKNALFFNEPNEGSQCNVAANDAIGYWMNDYLPIRQKGIALGSAATTNAPSGLQWNKDFIAACVGAGNSRADCTPDFTAIHWYAMSAQDLMQYVENFHNELGGDIWITEYALQDFNGGPQGDEGQVWAFHQTIAAWFDQTDYVKKYSPFGVMQNMQGVNEFNRLMSGSGEITALGSWYINSS